MRLPFLLALSFLVLVGCTPGMLGVPSVEREWSVPRVIYVLDYKAKTLNDLALVIGPPHHSNYQFNPGNAGWLNEWYPTREKWFHEMYVKPSSLVCNLQLGTSFVVYSFTDRLNMAGGSLFVFHTEDGNIVGWAASNYLFSGGGFERSRLVKRKSLQ